MVGTKAPVTIRALIQRMNRKLAREGKVLKKSRGTGVVSHEFGDYYIVNLRTHLVTERRIDPVALAQELGVLRAWETAIKEEE